MDLHHLSQQLHVNPSTTRRIPPVNQWNPPFCGDMDLLIKANGQWWHEGRQMTRQGLIDLFASVLWRENEQYYLKTPVEKIGIQVEDVPLFVNDVNLLHTEMGTHIECVTSHGDRIIIDEAHPLILHPFQGEIRPYVNIRFNLDACIMRHAFYHLLEWCELSEDGNQTVLRVPTGKTQQLMRFDSDML